MPIPAQMIAMLQRMRAHVEKNCDYVGPSFAEEARKIMDVSMVVARDARVAVYHERIDTFRCHQRTGSGMTPCELRFGKSWIQCSAHACRKITLVRRID
jgi:hypothetical protein